MKKTILSLAFLLVTTVAGAQSLLLGDTNQDGELTIADVTKSVNMILGKEAKQTLSIDPYRLDNSMVMGTWYASDGTSFAFNADGTTTYPGGATYEVLPSLGRLLIYDATGLPAKGLALWKATSEYLLVMDYVTGAFTRYTSTKPDISGTIDTHSYVDLGLPSGTLWATCNIGASKPEEYGDYFSWGETVPYGKEDRSNGMNYAYNGNSYIKTYFDWSTYKYCNGNYKTLTQYCSSSSFGNNGFTDVLTELEPDDDAAYVNWGADWRMPTIDQFSELINSENTTTEWTTQNGVYGRKITSKTNGNSLFLPAAGARNETSLSEGGSGGNYWSRSLFTGNPGYARSLYFNSGYISPNSYQRCSGQSVRPVCASNAVTNVKVTGITLNESSLNLERGGYETLTATVLPSNASNPKVSWSSSNEAVATVDANGLVTAVGSGTCTITATAADGSGVKATCAVTVSSDNSGSTDPHSYVDLGLPSGTLWATCNIGADNPEDYGLYFAWGETTGYTSDTSDGHSFDWTSYKYAIDDKNNLTKYCYDSSYGYNGFTDTLTELEPEDDAAYVNWGGEWRMPTDDQLSELRTKCTWTWTKMNGVNGYEVKGPNGNTLFLPAAGDRVFASLYGTGSYGCYLLRTVNNISGPYYAYYLYFNSGGVYLYGHTRDEGRSVRPVRASNATNVKVTDVTLNKTRLNLERGGYETLVATVLSSNASNPKVSWTSSNQSVATVDANGLVTAVADGTCTITVTCSANDGSVVKATCAVTVWSDNSGTIGGRAYVDLALPSGTLWATCNVGASNPEDYGDYFAWGETVPYGKEDRSNETNYAYNVDSYIKTYFDWSTYKYCNGNCNLTKYCGSSSYGYNGFTDSKTELDYSDDAAYVNWGSDWCMPSYDQFRELINSSYTATEWTTQNGVYGRKITSKTNGNSLFLPAAGDRYGSSLGSAGSYGYYWSHTLNTSSPYYAYYLGCVSLAIYTSYGYRNEGFSVRPVRLSQ